MHGVSQPQRAVEMRTRVPLHEELVVPELRTTWLDGNHPTPETSHALSVRQTPRYGPVIPGTMRHGLSNTSHAPTTSERGTISHLSETTCLPDAAFIFDRLFAQYGFTVLSAQE